MFTAHHVAEPHFAYKQLSWCFAAAQTLEPNHTLRVLLKPFTLNEHSVNSAAYSMLVRDHSVLVHGAGPTAQRIASDFHYVYSGLDYSQTVPNMLEARDLDQIVDTSHLPLHSQERQLYKAHRVFADRFAFVPNRSRYVRWRFNREILASHHYSRSAYRPMRLPTFN